MADRRMEWYLFLGIVNCVRHTHPGLAPLEQPQFPDFGRSQGENMREVARWLDGELAAQRFVAGERYTIADITAFCALEFARGLMKFAPVSEGWRTCRPGATASRPDPVLRSADAFLGYGFRQFLQCEAGSLLSPEGLRRFLRSTYRMRLSPERQRRSIPRVILSEAARSIAGCSFGANGALLDISADSMRSCRDDK
jgi:hypothetical protein